MRAADSPPRSYHNASLMLVARSSRVTSITRSRETNKTSFALCLFDSDVYTLRLIYAVDLYRDVTVTRELSHSDLFMHEESIDNFLLNFQSFVTLLFMKMVKLVKILKFF